MIWRRRLQLCVRYVASNEQKSRVQEFDLSRLQHYQVSTEINDEAIRNLYEEAGSEICTAHVYKSTWKTTA